MNTAHSADIALEKACALPEANASDLGVKRSSVLATYTAAYQAQKLAKKMAEDGSIPDDERSSFVPQLDVDPRSIGKDPVVVCKKFFGE